MPRKLIRGVEDVLDFLNDPMDESGEREAKREAPARERRSVVAFLLERADASKGKPDEDALRAAARAISSGEHMR